MRKRFGIQTLVPFFGVILACASFCSGNSGNSGSNKTENVGNSRSLDTLTKPTLPTLPEIDDSALTDIKDSLYSTNLLGFNPFDIMDNLLKFNRIPNWVAQLGNFSLLQAALLLALGGVIVGSAILVAEAWSFKNEQDQEYYFQHKIPQFFDTSPIQSNSHSAYGPPVSSGYNRRQSSNLRRPTPNFYNNNSNLGGFRNQPNPDTLYRNTQKSKDPLLFYNYAHTADNTRLNNNNNNNNNKNNNDRSSSIITVQDIKDPGSSGSPSYFVFPTFDKDKKKKIMFG